MIEQAIDFAFGVVVFVAFGVIMLALLFSGLAIRSMWQWLKWR